MRLTIITPDSLYEHEVDPSMEVQDVQALLEAEVSKRLRPHGCRAARPRSQTITRGDAEVFFRPT